MMKKIGSVLIVALLLSIFQPCLAQSDNTGTANSPNGYILKLKNSSDSSSVVSESSGLNVICAKAGLYHADTLTEISKLGDAVEFYEPDGTATLSALPDDKYAIKQWSIDSTEISSAWDKGYNGAGVRIAVIDSGIDAGHEDLAGAKIDTGFNMIDGTDDVTDKLGHGTFVSGVLVATRDNKLGIAGFCTDATIVPLKCFSDSLETKASYVISAIYEAVDGYACDVINLSVGMDINLKSLEEAVEYAASKGIIVVSAVGNDGTAKLDYPAAYQCVVGVGAVNTDGRVANFSQRNDSVYVVAPGGSIPGLGIISSSSYVSGSGTSYSTPFVTAAAVILKQYAPSATYFDFATLLRKAAVDQGETGYDTSYGYGSLDYAKFVEAMEEYNFDDIGKVYSDVEAHWAKESIRYCVNLGLFNGITDSSFEPETDMSRAMFVTVLARMSGEDISSYTNSFSDVPSDAWYKDACAWASEKGIVTGTGDGIFNPDGKITREQIAALLYRYAKLYGISDGTYDDTELSFYDSGSISAWAQAAMQWANQNELITGRENNTICPLDSAKRSELATIMSRFNNSFKY
jgi:hypothetical protein